MPDNKLVALAARSDIFVTESDRRIGVTTLIAIILGIILGFLFLTMEFVDTPSEFFENLPPEIAAKLVTLEKKKEPEKKDKKIKTPKKKSLKAPKLKATKAAAGVGKGNIKNKVTQKGLLAVISGKSRNRRVAGANFLNNVFSKDLDAVLKNIGGLKTAGKAGYGRMGKAGGKFNKGYSGGGGAGGIDDLLAGLAGSASTVSGLTRRADVKLPSSKWIAGQAGGLGGRSPKEIQRVVMQHIGGLRAEYNKRLRAKPNLRGKISVRFTINTAGRVIRAKVMKSTMRDKMLEFSIVRRIKAWKFDSCSKCGTATVTYPFAFSQ